MATCLFMKREMMNYNNIKEEICSWIKLKLQEASCAGLVIGVSGGIDSAVTSTLCALTGAPIIVVSMPINQERGQLDRSAAHMKWLCDKFSNVKNVTIELSETHSSFTKMLTEIELSELTDANLQSRIRMCCLYAIANSNNCIVVGTGNKVEDYGIGFFTKYGDGGVDISPIADLLKSEVRELGRHLGVLQEIIDARPTDGLWGDNRSDEDQIGASYEELEWALEYYDLGHSGKGLSLRQKEVLEIYKSRHLTTKHKLEVPPTCHLNRTNQEKQ